MKEKLPALVAIFILVILLVGTHWAASYAEKAIPIDPLPPDDHTPSAVSGKFVMVSSDENNYPDTRLEGNHFRYYSADKSYEFDDAVSISQKKDQPRMTGKARLARITDDGSTIRLTGKAHLHREPQGNDKQLDIYSEELFIYPDEDLVKSFVPTTVVQDNSSLSGTGMTYNNKTRQLHISSGGNAVIAPEDMNDRSTRRKQPEASAPSARSSQ